MDWFLYSSLWYSVHTKHLYNMPHSTKHIVLCLNTFFHTLMDASEGSLGLVRYPVHLPARVWFTNLLTSSWPAPLLSYSHPNLTEIMEPKLWFMLDTLTILWSTKCSIEVTEKNKCKRSTTNHNHRVQVCLMLLCRLTSGNLCSLLVHSVEE